MCDSAKLVVVFGDMCSAQLGLADDIVDGLIGVTDVLHCAAQVHHAKPYEDLRASNVVVQKMCRDMCVDMCADMYVGMCAMAMLVGMGL